MATLTVQSLAKRASKPSRRVKKKAPTIKQVQNEIVQENENLRKQNRQLKATQKVAVQAIKENVKSSPNSVLGVPTRKSDENRLRRLMENYCKCLYMPSSCYSRIPDMFSKQSSLTQSRLMFDLTGHFANTADDGRFAAAFRANFGDTDMPTNYQNLIVDSSGGWPAPNGFNSVNAYKSSQTLFSDDLRVDQYFDELGQPPNSYATVYGANGQTNFFTGNSISAYNLGVTVTSPNATTTNFTLPVGTFQVTLAASYAGSAPVHAVFSAVAPNNITNLANTTAATGGVFYGEVQVYIVNIKNPGSPLTLVMNDALQENVNQNPFVNFVPLFYPQDNISNPAGGGLASSIRPVGMSVLYTSLLPSIQDGGNVCIAFVPKGTIAQSFATANPGNKPFMLYDGLCKYAQDKYDGAHCQGAYAFWTPEDEDDLKFLPIGSQNDHDYPEIILCGRVIPGQALTGDVTIGRLEINRIWEWTSESNFVSKVTIQGSVSCIEAAQRCFAEMGHCSANGKHLDNFASLVKRLGGKIVSGFNTAKNYYQQHRNVIDPMASLAASALLG